MARHARIHAEERNQAVNFSQGTLCVPFKRYPRGIGPQHFVVTCFRDQKIHSLDAVCMGSVKWCYSRENEQSPRRQQRAVAGATFVNRPVGV